MSVCMCAMYVRPLIILILFFRKSIHFWQRYAQKNNSYIFVLSNLVNQSYYSILFNGCSAIYVLWLYCIVLSELYIESWCCTVYCTCTATLLSLWCLWCTLFSLPCHIIFTEHSLIKQEACQWVLCFLWQPSDCIDLRLNVFCVILWNQVNDCDFTSVVDVNWFVVGWSFPVQNLLFNCVIWHRFRSTVYRLN